LKIIAVIFSAAETSVGLKENYKTFMDRETENKLRACFLIASISVTKIMGQHVASPEKNGKRPPSKSPFTVPLRSPSLVMEGVPAAHVTGNRITSSRLQTDHRGRRKSTLMPTPLLAKLLYGVFFTIGYIYTLREVALYVR